MEIVEKQAQSSSQEKIQRGEDQKGFPEGEKKKKKKTEGGVRRCCDTLQQAVSRLLKATQTRTMKEDGR